MTRRQQRGMKLLETWVHHRYKGETAEICLNMSDGTFHANYGEQSFLSDKLENLRDILRKQVESTMQLEWIGVIEIKMSHSCRVTRWVPKGRRSKQQQDAGEAERAKSGEAEMNLEFSRYWMAKRPDGVWMQCTVWHSEDSKGSDNYDFNRNQAIHDPLPRRLNTSEFRIYGFDMNKFKIPIVSKSHDWREKPKHYVLYTPELWAALNEVSFRLSELAEKLTGLLTSEAGLKQIEALVQKALPAPAEGKA